MSQDKARKRLREVIRFLKVHEDTAARYLAKSLASALKTRDNDYVALKFSNKTDEVTVALLPNETEVTLIGWLTRCNRDLWGVAYLRAACHARNYKYAVVYHDDRYHRR